MAKQEDPHPEEKPGKTRTDFPEKLWMNPWKCPRSGWMGIGKSWDRGRCPSMAGGELDGIEGLGVKIRSPGFRNKNQDPIILQIP